MSGTVWPLSIVDLEEKIGLNWFLFEQGAT
jgi:hypothetical protein